MAMYATVSSSPIPAVLAKLAPFHPIDVPDLRVFLETVPDPRSRRGRWYSLASILLVCAAAAAKPGEEHVSEGAAFPAEW